MKADDAINRQAAIDTISELNAISFYEAQEDSKECYYEIRNAIKQLPPVTPQYTDAEIQKMQDLEFAEIQKAYEIGKAEGSEVLDKIRAEIDAHREKLKIMADDDWYAGKIRGYDCAIEIIDKYKASPTGAERSEE